MTGVQTCALPIYRNNCTTVTELLERRYNGGGIRTLISALFLLGSILLGLPAALYSGSLFLKSMFGVDWSVLWFAAPMAIIAAVYTITGGLKAVAVMDTFSGIGVLAIAMLIVVLALNAVGFDIVTDMPPERISMVGAIDSPIPIHTLFTGMLFIQLFYWSTNQNITQKAMTAPTVREAQKGVLAAAAVRILIIPLIVVVPGVVAFKLFGDTGDQSYGRLVAHVLPPWMSGAFAAMMAAAVIAHTAAIMNGTVALYAMDFHDKFVAKVKDFWRLAAIVTIVLTISSVLIVPVFENTESIINTLQQLNGLLSMPILSAFVVGLLFKNVESRAAIAGVIWGVGFYAGYNTLTQKGGALFGVLPPWVHYIDMMLVTLVSSIIVALLVNRAMGQKASFVGFGRKPTVAVA